MVLEGTAREADAKLAELTVEAGRGRVQSSAHTLSELLERGLEQAASEGLERVLGRDGGIEPPGRALGL